MSKRVLFSEKEMTCKCGCGLLIKNKTLIRQLVIARLIYNRPMIVSSWCRCLERNEDVGGSINSNHLRGEAVDITCVNSYGRFYMLNAFLKAGFTRIGISLGYLHLDVGENSQSNLIWLDT